MCPLFTNAYIFIVPLNLSRYQTSSTSICQCSSYLLQHVLNLSLLSDFKYQHLSVFPLFTKACIFIVPLKLSPLSDFKYQHLSVFLLFTEACIFTVPLNLVRYQTSSTSIYQCSTESQSVIRHQVLAFISVPFIY